MRKLALLCIFAAVCCIALAAGVFLRPAPAADPASGSVSAPASSAPDPTAAPSPSPSPAPSPAPAGVNWPALAAPFDLTGLETERLGWGQGKQVNERNQPISAVAYQEKYGQWGGVFLAPEAETPTIYLTFDFGYETGYSAAILDTLKEKNAPATFFVVGSYAENNAETVERMLAEGHTVGSHSATHKDMTALSDEEARAEITGFNEQFARQFGATPTLFRFPEGVFSQRLLALAAGEGMRSVFWSYAYADWDASAQPDVAESLSKALAAAHPDAVYLLHPMATNSAMLGDLIDGLRAAGYQLAAL
ncbi:polysaccharide deacetylase family protein [Candidatus Allofournierella excrementigallinarum]|uniref:polysaccharide deacetylase family protein n=1 Tax=Candidatus Allofournierella excrementigallinarum TaxID=2838592 RepID=UPI00374E98DB